MSMDSKVCFVFQLALLGVALALAGPIIAGGSVEVGIASRATAAGAYAAWQTTTAQATTTAKSVMMGLEVHRRILGSIHSSSLNPDSPACLGSCPAPGGAYTRGCSKTYQCSG